MSRSRGNWKEIEPGWWVTDSQLWSVVEEDDQEWIAYENAFDGKHLGTYRTFSEAKAAVEDEILWRSQRYVSD